MITSELIVQLYDCFNYELRYQFSEQLENQLHKGIWDTINTINNNVEFQDKLWDYLHTTLKGKY